MAPRSDKQKNILSSKYMFASQFDWDWQQQIMVARILSPKKSAPVGFSQNALIGIYETNPRNDWWWSGRVTGGLLAG